MAGASRIAGITITIGGETTELQKSLKDVNKSLKDTYSQLRDVNKLLKLDPKNTELLRQKQELLSKAIADTKTKLDKEKQALEQLKNADGAEKTKQQQEALTREIIATEKQLESLEKEYKDFGNIGVSNTKAVTEKLDGVSASLKGVSDKVRTAGDYMMTHVTAPIVGIGTAAMVSFNKVDTALDTVTQKTGASGKALEELHEITREIGRTTPFDFEQVGIAVGEVNTRFGLTGQNLQDLSEQFLKFSKVNSVDLNSSIDSVQKMMAAFNIETGYASEVLDMLTDVAQNTGVNVGTLSGLLVSNATALQGMGMNAADAAYLLGELETSGIDTSTMITGLSKVQQKAMKEGISMQDAFREALSNSESAIEYFGAKAGPKLYESFHNGTVSADMFKGGIHDLNDSLGKLDQTYENTLSIQDGINQALNNLNDTGYELGKTIGEILAPILSEVNDLLKQFNEWFRSLDDDTKQAIVRCAALTAAIAPVLIILSSVIGAISGIVGGISGLIKIGGSVIGFFTGTSGAATGTAEAVKTTSAAMSGLSAVGTTLAGVLSTPLVIAMMGVGSAALMTAAYWDELGETFQAVGQLIKAQINLFVADFNMLVAKGKVAFNQFASDMKSKISEGVEKARTGISTGLGAAQTYINTFGNSARTKMQETWSNITSRISGAMTSIKSGISSGFSAAQSAATSAMNGMKSSISGAWSSIQTNTSSVLGSVRSNVSSAWNDIKSNVSTAVSGMKSSVSQTMGQLQSSLSDTWGKIKSTATETASKINSDVSGAWSQLQGSVSQSLGTLKTNVSSCWTGSNGITSIIDSAKGTINTAISGMSSTINNFSSGNNNPFTKLKNTVSSTFGTGTNGIQGIIDSALTAIKNAVSNTTLSFGSIKIPTFKWNGTTDAKEGTVAKLIVGSTTVNSYAGAMASGVILDRPTLFGMMDGNLLRAGEAGKEVVIGANSLSSMIRQSATNTALNADVANILGLLAQYLPETANQNVVLDSGKLVGALSPALNRQFGMMIRG